MDPHDASFYEYMSTPYMKEKTECGCGSTFERKTLRMHEEPTDHKSWLADSKNVNELTKCNCGDSYKWKDRTLHIKTDQHKKRVQVIC